MIDTRASDDRMSIRRRRECVDCGYRYTTYERYEPTQLKVVKKDNAREPFQREKVFHGLEKACWKLPISHDQIEAMVSAIEAEVNENFDVEVDSGALGEIVMKHLGRLNQVAYVRFASVYRKFTDVRDFVDELQPILRSQYAPSAARLGATEWTGDVAKSPR